MLNHSCHRRYSIFILFCILSLIVTIAPGCGDRSTHDPEDRVLVRIGGSTATVRDFHDELESDISSLSLENNDPDSMREDRYQALTRLTDELLIMERARELGIKVGDEEVEKAAADFKKDFPDDTFEKTLIENGISYKTWKKGLRRRLLMEKVIRKDVSKNSFQVPLPPGKTKVGVAATDMETQTPTDTDVSPEDNDNSDEELSDNSQDNAQDNSPKNAEETDEASGQANEETAPENKREPNSLSIIPETKEESEYDTWIERLRKQYKIEIDWKLWEKIGQEDAEGE